MLMSKIFLKKGNKETLEWNLYVIKYSKYA